MSRFLTVRSASLAAVLVACVLSPGRAMAFGYADLCAPQFVDFLFQSLLDREPGERYDDLVAIARKTQGEGGRTLMIATFVRSKAFQEANPDLFDESGRFGYGDLNDAEFAHRLALALLGPEANGKRWHGVLIAMKALYPPARFGARYRTITMSTMVRTDVFLQAHLDDYEAAQQVTCE